MSFQTPVTVQHVLEGIHSKKYLLPAIQREFVWDTDQIRALFDSLLRGYPIASFLFWEVEPATTGSYTYYDFLTHYHQRDHPYASKAAVPPGKEVIAILDGQQRLTALNIGIYGSHAEKRKYAHFNNPDAFQKKRLYLNLLRDADPGELGLTYDLRFLTDEEAAPASDGADGWYRVGDILEMPDSGPSMMKELVSRQAGSDTDAFDRLYALYTALRVFQPINYYLETSQDTDKVLDIFVRVNSGGTTLSYSDLLLSMATNQWVNADAREEVRDLVQQLNTGSSRDFSFTKDNVLKTALMIAGVDLRFKVSNFTQKNMAKVEEHWDVTRQSLLRAAALLDQFGFSARSLTANNAVIPIAYYIAQRELGDYYLTSSADSEDREAVRYWVTRALLKRGFWAGSDGLLTRLRAEIDKHGETGFPVAQIDSAMASLGKHLAFDDAEVDELLETRFGSRAFQILSLLYPGLDYSKVFHVDHVFPASYFRRNRLIKAGVPESDVDEYLERANLLPNLQLLGGVPNMEKQDTLPSEWLEDAFPDEVKRATYRAENDLEDVPDLVGFLDFYDARRERMRIKLVNTLGVNKSAPAD